MNQPADENVDKAIVDRLRSDGHTVLYIAETDPGIDDDAVLFRTRQIGNGPAYHRGQRFR